MRYTDIIEARRNPEQNPKTSAYSRLEQYYKSGEEYYISYTNVEKIGINPRSTFNTPIGIYTYPLGDVFSDIQQAGSVKAVPYAGDAPFIWVLKPNSTRVMEVGQWYGSNEYKTDVAKLRQYFEDVGLLDENHFDNILYKSKSTSFEDTYSSYIWNLTRMLSNSIPGKSANPIKWNWIFRNVLKYDYATDSESGTIHKNEPSQAVFFSKDAVTVVEKLRNEPKKIYKKLDPPPKQNKNFDEYLLNTKADVFDFEVKSLNLSLQTQRILVQRNPQWVTRIKNLDPVLYPTLKQYKHVVTEPGLTNLHYDQVLTDKELHDASLDHGEGSFNVKPFN